MRSQVETKFGPGPRGAPCDRGISWRLFFRKSSEVVSPNPQEMRSLGPWHLYTHKSDAEVIKGAGGLMLSGQGHVLRFGFAETLRLMMCFSRKTSAMEVCAYEGFDQRCLRGRL